MSNTNAGTKGFIGNGFNNFNQGSYGCVVGGSHNKNYSNNSFIGCGEYNINKGSQSNIVGGQNNTNNGDINSIVGGKYNYINSSGNGNNLNFIGGGGFNAIGTTADNSFIGGGYSNTITNNKAVIVGGRINFNSGYLAALVGGVGNTLMGQGSFLGGGQSGYCSGNESFLGGGCGNINKSYRGLIVGGQSNYNGPLTHGSIVGGFNNTNMGQKGFLGGGQSNHNGGYRSVIGGGFQNQIIGSGIGTGSTGVDSFIGGGFNNTISIANATIPGGVGLLLQDTNSFARAAVGQYNLENNGPSGTIGSNARIFVVGNGGGTGSRSNAFSVDHFGNAVAQMAFLTSGADYAEYFESIDGESIPVGTSVTLVGDKIKMARFGDTPFGVVSVRPTVIGNEYSDHWQGKFLTDEWGRIMYETNGPMVSKDYDPNRPYLPRKARKEWHPIALMGQVRLRNGSIVAEGWRKMKDINEDISLWLIK